MLFENELTGMNSNFKINFVPNATYYLESKQLQYTEWLKINALQSSAVWAKSLTCFSTVSSAAPCGTLTPITAFQARRLQ